EVQDAPSGLSGRSPRLQRHRDRRLGRMGGPGRGVDGGRGTGDGVHGTRARAGGRGRQSVADPRGRLEALRMDLDFTEEQEMLRETIRSLLQKYSSSEIVRELEDDPIGYRQDLWEELARQGLLGLTIPEEHGGSGMTALELVILYEELGRALTSSPHLVSCVL